MSYDITIRSDDRYSCYAQTKPLAAFVATLSHVVHSGEGFILNDRSRYMEVDFEVVDECGDDIEEYGRDYPEINRVALHIPYAALGDAPERDYFPIAFAIARHLGWRVFDEQRGEYLSGVEPDS